MVSVVNKMQYETKTNHKECFQQKKRKDKIKKIEAEISRNWKEKVYELKLNRISIMQLEVSRKWYHNSVLYVIPILFYTPPLTNLQRVAQNPLG